ncbi:hypothetical protein [Cryobacterium glaciale]|uniref:hypothetical protein n=1 Tax=Cryobacterium glaciale TaxID=1259145 RepID=UPI00141BB418|nr:hypothetical protein [Cryobacterium glaciale]
MCARLRLRATRAVLTDVGLWASTEANLPVGFVYLLVLTRGFRRPTPMLDLKE